MGLEFDSHAEDNRGKILFCSHNKSFVRLVEIKKGYSRGGHYHKVNQLHIVISGSLEVKEINIKTKNETTRKIVEPTTMDIPKYHAHLFTALEDSLILEYSKEEIESFEYEEYRKIIKNVMDNKH
tara:strand:- start:475 stop:849 length:375 start_codon:yes stop_codon:yes gene_type:complete